MLSRLYKPKDRTQPDSDKAELTMLKYTDEGAEQWVPVKTVSPQGHAGGWGRVCGVLGAPGSGHGVQGAGRGVRGAGCWVRGVRGMGCGARNARRNMRSGGRG